MSSERPALPERFVIREVMPRDLDGIHALAAHLDSVNMPHDKRVLRAMLQRARDSFSGKIEDPTRREYLFVLEGADSGRLAGTSMIFAQHGHLDAPHVFFEVVKDERYSSTLGRHFHHTTLRLGFSYRGPTEIGALVLDPELRAFGLGKLLSLSRFAFIGMYRSRFQDEVLAELLPPLGQDGRSDLWEYLGQRFTGLSYQEADRLSHANKEFIYALFPQTPLYASLLPTEVADQIGQVGTGTRSAERILKSIGFRYCGHIDPFDGGPHFTCPTDQITLVRDGCTKTIAETPLADNLEQALFGGIKPEGVGRYLIGFGRVEGPLRFRAVSAAARLAGEQVELTEETRGLLNAKPDQAVWLTPL